MNDNEKVQKLTVDLLNVFIKICEENNLTYYFIAGALIGVVRHKGFIPWDDDIDVAMPRKDFDKFISIVENMDSDEYGLCNRHTNKDWHFALSQFIDLKSEIEIDLAKEKRRSYIWIDIFPLDGLPSNKIKRFLRIKHILFLRYMIQMAHIETQVDSHRKRPIYERFIIKFCTIFRIGKLINSDKLLDKLEKLLRKTDYDSAEYIGEMLGRYREKEVYPKKYFGNPVKGEFENILVDIPEDTHSVLETVYGDYMCLPPEEERVAHNVKIIKSRY